MLLLKRSLSLLMMKISHSWPQTACLVSFKQHALCPALKYWALPPFSSLGLKWPHSEKPIAGVPPWGLPQNNAEGKAWTQSPGTQVTHSPTYLYVRSKHKCQNFTFPSFLFLLIAFTAQSFFISYTLLTF